MFVTVVAVLCHLITPVATIAPDRDCTAEESKIVEVVTDTDKDPEHLDFMGCQLGQAALADWKKNHPTYFKNTWRIGRVMCVPGHYEPPGRA
jgi:hypothetical protein